MEKIELLGFSAGELGFRVYREVGNKYGSLHNYIYKVNLVPRLIKIFNLVLNENHNSQMPFPSSITFHLSPKPLFSLQKLGLFCSLSHLKMDSSSNPNSTNESLTAQNYPVPLSPPLPLISKEIELARAMSASSRSKLFTLSESDILYQDQWLIAVNKPHGVYCETLLESVPRVLADLADSTHLSEGSKGSQPELHLANRLDRDTSGVMLITKSNKVAAKLVKAFTNHKVQKTYIARCLGSSPKWQKITVKSGHGRSKFGAWRVYATSDIGKKLPGGSVVREMETTFEVLSINGKESFKDVEEFEKGENVIDVREKGLNGVDLKDEILVRAFPKSGRTHQIRLHCQYLGISIRGDVKYGGVYEWKGRVFDGHELHAESLTFEHPVSDLCTTFRAPLPSWATAICHPL